MVVIARLRSWDRVTVSLMPPACGGLGQEQLLAPGDRPPAGAHPGAPAVALAGDHLDPVGGAEVAAPGVPIQAHVPELDLEQLEPGGDLRGGRCAPPRSGAWAKPRAPSAPRARSPPRPASPGSGPSERPLAASRHNAMKFSSGAGPTTGSRSASAARTPPQLCSRAPSAPDRSTGPSAAVARSAASAVSAAPGSAPFTWVAPSRTCPGACGAA